MLDLGTSFLASVERDPDALAIVDGTVRLTYAEWYRRISAVVAGFDSLGLKTGDHIVTVIAGKPLLLLKCLWRRNRRLASFLFKAHP